MVSSAGRPCGPFGQGARWWHLRLSHRAPWIARTKRAEKAEGHGSQRAPRRVRLAPAHSTPQGVRASIACARSNTGYDGRASVDAYLNQRHVKELLGVDLDLEWVSCSPEVDRKMGHDVMKSVRPLVSEALVLPPAVVRW